MPLLEILKVWNDFCIFKSFSGSTHAQISFGIRHHFEGEKLAEDHSSLDQSTKCHRSEQREHPQFVLWGTDTCGYCGVQWLHQVPPMAVYKQRFKVSWRPREGSGKRSIRGGNRKMSYEATATLTRHKGDRDQGTTVLHADLPWLTMELHPQ